MNMLIVYRTLDLILSLLMIVLLAPVFFFVTGLCYYDTGSPFFFQKRVGRNMQKFTLVKFRSMALETESVASHLVDPGGISRIGHFIRKTKLDEIPQLINVLKGDMSLVGPRPNLDSQAELIAERRLNGVYNVRPGITGLAQISGVDMSTPKKLAEIDALMIRRMSLRLYFLLIIRTALGKGRGDSVKR